MIKECSFLWKGALCNIDVEWFFKSHTSDNRLSLNQAKKHRWKRQKSSWSVWIWLNNFLYFIAGFISGLTGHSSVSRAFLLAVDRPLWSRRQRKFSGSWFASSNSLSTKIRTETIRAVFDFFSVFQTLFFQRRTSKLSVIKNTCRNGFFCVVFSFHTRLVRLVRCSDKTIWALVSKRTGRQKTRKWNNSEIINPLFDGLTYSARGHFAHCSYSSSPIRGSEKYYATRKISARMAC